MLKPRGRHERVPGSCGFAPQQTEISPGKVPTSPVASRLYIMCLRKNSPWSRKANETDWRFERKWRLLYRSDALFPSGFIYTREPNWVQHPRVDAYADERRFFRGGEMEQIAKSVQKVEKKWKSPSRCIPREATATRPCYTLFHRHLAFLPKFLQHNRPKQSRAAQEQKRAVATYAPILLLHNHL